MADAPFAPRSEIRAAQLARAQSLLAALIPANRFYAAKLSQAGVGAKIQSLEEFSARVPFTTKPELVQDQRAQPPYGTNLTFPLDRYIRLHQTSGTAGTPIRWLDTSESWASMIENWEEVFRAAQVTRGDRIFFAFSFGPFIGFWLAFEAAAKIGCLCISGGGMSSAARVRTLLDHRATVLCSTPTYALHLAEVARAENLNLAEGCMRTILVAGEPGGSIPATRERLSSLWPGARVFDHHGMTEVGPVTHECPDHPCVLHVIEPAYFAEVINPDSAQAVEPGQIGELVLTTLFRTGSPLLRYRTGDLVKAAFAAKDTRSAPTPCSCGRHTTALAGGIVGRADDMVVVRGVNVFPSAVEEIVRNQHEVVEYRVQVDTTSSLTELSVEIEMADSGPDAVAVVTRLEKTFDQALALRVPVRVVPKGTLPRFELKSKRWVKSLG